MTGAMCFSEHCYSQQTHFTSDDPAGWLQRRRITHWLWDEHVGPAVAFHFGSGAISLNGTVPVNSFFKKGNVVFFSSQKPKPSTSYKNPFVPSLCVSNSHYFTSPYTKWLWPRYRKRGLFHNSWILPGINDCFWLIWKWFRRLDRTTFAGLWGYNYYIIIY